jgi:hypothetical protein
MLQAVSKAKEAVAAATSLAHPAVGTELSLAVDAPANSVGASLQQRLTATAAWQPLSFFQKNWIRPRLSTRLLIASCIRVMQEFTISDSCSRAKNSLCIQITYH